MSERDRINQSLRNKPTRGTSYIIQGNWYEGSLHQATDERHFDSELEAKAEGRDLRQRILERKSEARQVQVLVTRRDWHLVRNDKGREEFHWLGSGVILEELWARQEETPVASLRERRKQAIRNYPRAFKDVISIKGYLANEVGAARHPTFNDELDHIATTLKRFEKDLAE